MEKRPPRLRTTTTIATSRGLCTHCPDCLIYGYAAIEAEGARKARVITDSCFTVRPYEIIQKQVKFNVIDEARHTWGTITEYDYTMPGVFLPSVETTVDITADEFDYLLSNILRTTRYGKEGTRQGFVRNHILTIIFSDVELFANLEFTQALYDAFVDDGKDLAMENLSLADFKRHTDAVIKQLTADIPGRLTQVPCEELEAILRDVQALNQNEERLSRFLRDINQSVSIVCHIMEMAACRYTVVPLNCWTMSSTLQSNEVRYMRQGPSYTTTHLFMLWAWRKVTHIRMLTKAGTALCGRAHTTERVHLRYTWCPASDCSSPGTVEHNPGGICFSRQGAFAGLS